MNIQNHICTDNTVNGVPFEARIIRGKGEKNSRTFRKLLGINYICVHNTGNSSFTAGADNHSSYMQNVENSDKDYLSWHITVDAQKAIQHIPFDEVTWHAGDGSNGNGNTQAISIEIAENKDYPQCEENAIKVICALMKEYSIPIERVQPHRYFSPVNKLCPWKILKTQSTWKSDWKAFQERILSEYNRLYADTSDREKELEQTIIELMMDNDALKAENQKLNIVVTKVKEATSTI